MNLKDALQEKLTRDELDLLVRGYDVVGDMAITIIPPELEAKEKIIGEAILGIRKNVKVVARRDGNYSGELRTIPLKIIAGENRKETVHTEHGVRFALNPEKAYFSVRSGSERKRVAGLVQPGERILVMFSGIGAFPLVIAKNSMAAGIVGIEKNPHAHGYALQSLAMNKKIRNVEFRHGDVNEVMAAMTARFDRILMPLPTGAGEILPLALKAMKSRGWLHFYDFRAEGNFAESAAKVENGCVAGNRACVEARIVVCGHCSPNTYRICVDARIVERGLCTQVERP